VAETVTYQDKPWLKHYQPGVPEHVNYEEMCLPDFFERTAARFPNKVALYFEGYRMTYAQLKDMVVRFAACLHEFGIRKGDAVAILLPNTIPCVVAYYAIHRLGAVAVMNNPLYSDRELEHQLNDSGSKILITIDLLAARMVALRPKTKVKQIVYTSIGDYLPFPKNLLFPLVGKKKGLAADVAPADNLYRWKELIAQAKPESPSVKVTFEDVAMYQYTGGTTGVSKGAILTHGNLSKQTQQVAAWFPDLDDDNVSMGALPWSGGDEPGHPLWLDADPDPQAPARSVDRIHQENETDLCRPGADHVHRHPATSGNRQHQYEFH